MVGDELATRLALQAWIDDPFLGPVVPATFQAESPLSPDNGRWARVVLHQEIRAENKTQRSVWELELQPADTSQSLLPVAVVWDETSQPSRARVYCNKTLLGSDQVRGPVIPPEADLQLHPTMQRYSQALRAGDLQGLLEVLDPELRVRGPSGWIQETDVRTAFATRMASSGGVPIMYVTSTDDGTRVALEFISWRVPPHAGLGVYERSPSGRIVQFRAFEGPVRPRPPGLQLPTA
jgi:hypothetical protein